MTNQQRIIPPRSLDKILQYLHSGGRLMIRAYPPQIIEPKLLTRFEKAGAELLREKGDGYLIRRGKRWEYIFPGYLLAIN